MRPDRTSRARDPRPRLLALSVALVAFASAAAGEPVPTPAPRAAPAPVPEIPDSARLAPASVPYVNPLYRPLDSEPKLADRPAPDDFTSAAKLVLTVRLDETGKALDAQTVEAPLHGLSAPVPVLLPRWRFTPAKKGGQPFATWATYGIELLVALEKGSWTQFTIRAVAKDDPLPVLAREAQGDTWMTRYPRAVTPPDGTVSIEEAEELPAPRKTPWSLDASRQKSHVAALVLVSASGAAARIVPTGADAEPLALAWLRRMTPRWRLVPALLGGKPVDAWMALDATLDYTLDSAKEKGKRSIKKNLRGAPAETP